MKFTAYESYEEMFADLRMQMQKADFRVTPEQKRYRPGDIVVSDSGYGFPIFHEILDIEKIVKDDLMKHGRNIEDEAIETLDLYRQPHMKYYCFTKSYSETCPDGELGDFHRSVGIFKIPRHVYGGRVVDMNVMSYTGAKEAQQKSTPPKKNSGTITKQRNDHLPQDPLE